MNKSFKIFLIFICFIHLNTCFALNLDINQNLNDKLIPNNLQNLQQPGQKQMQQQMPSSINTTPFGEEDGLTPEYNSDCQFGTCLPGAKENPNPQTQTE